MQYRLTKHARERIEERRIPVTILEDALHNPTKVGYDVEGKQLIKKVYKKSGKEHLLLLVVRRDHDTMVIVTVIDTSKVKKYI